MKNVIIVLLFLIGISIGIFVIKNRASLARYNSIMREAFYKTNKAYERNDRIVIMLVGVCIIALMSAGLIDYIFDIIKGN